MVGPYNYYQLVTSDISAVCRVQYSTANQVGVNYPLTTFTWPRHVEYTHIWKLSSPAAGAATSSYISVHSIYY